jgi:16S rRNA (uracil1498-N3)-methyltransferase
MAAPWFFVPGLPSVGGAWLLPSDEARHATGAKRLSSGDAVVLFDGNGRIAEATLDAARGREGLTVLVHRVDSRSRPGRRIHLACALPKGDRLATLIDMTTQLGIVSFTPLRCERSVVAETEARADRIRRIQIESCKQARWPWLPELRDETTPAAIASRGGQIFVAHPGGEEPDRLEASLADELSICIGPEGGFSEAELASLRGAGARAVDLGPSILRIETAATVAVASLR